MPNVQGLVDVEVMNTPIKGGFERKESDGSMVFVIFGEADPDRPPMSIGDFIDAFKKEGAKLETSDIAGALPSSGTGSSDKSALSSITVNLKNIYLYKLIKKAAADTNNKPTVDPDSTRYAIWIELKGFEALTKDFPIKLKSISLKIWTDSVPKDIQDKLGISEMKKLLS